METLEFIYLVCFGVGLLFALVSAFAADVFGGHDAHAALGGGADHGAGVGGTDGHAEAGFGAHDMPGFSPLSPTVLAAFVTAFGGFGLMFTQIKATRSPFVSAPLAVLSGWVVAALVFWLFSAVFRKTQSSSEAHVAEMIGQTGTIITPIPLNGVGEIAYVAGGTRYTAPARTDDGHNIASGQPVVITRIAGNEFHVTAY